MMLYAHWPSWSNDPKTIDIILPVHMTNRKSRGIYCSNKETQMKFFITPDLWITGKAVQYDKHLTQKAHNYKYN